MDCTIYEGRDCSQINVALLNSKTGGSRISLAIPYPDA